MQLTTTYTLTLTTLFLYFSTLTLVPLLPRSFPVLALILPCPCPALGLFLSCSCPAFDSLLLHSTSLILYSTHSRLGEVEENRGKAGKWEHQNWEEEEMGCKTFKENVWSHEKNESDRRTVVKTRRSGGKPWRNWKWEPQDWEKSAKKEVGDASKTWD